VSDGRLTLVEADALKVDEAALAGDRGMWSPTCPTTSARRC
jgi:hypothetical protein